MASSSPLPLSFPSSSSSQNWEHDVFPSFHGPDVRNTFLSHVLKEFRSKGINMFIDNEIKRGESIGPELKRAIRGSKIAIVLLSKNYASSSWCLDELVEIMKREFGQTVITIFYEVDPTVVKKQTGDFGRVFKKTCQRKTKKKIESWRKALEGVSTIAGYHSRNWDDEAAMIEIIAADISKMLNHLTPSPDFDHLIGMGDHMERMKLLLRLDLDEVRMIGIWGPPGIGKTTIARFLFNQVSSSFQNSAIMVNIKGSYPRPCLDEYNAQLQLQKQMLSEMINQKDIVIPHLGVAQGRLRDKKVLLVLDDVDRSAQLDALAKDVQWFGHGSRIIITTEDLKLLKAYKINHIYKVKFPSNDEALQMFCMYAFGQKTPEDGFAELAREITYLVGQLPLGLKVMGSYFRGLSEQQWSMEVPRLRANLNGDIESILKFSYDALCDEDKDLFLHIACFFNYDNFEKVEEYLAESFKNVRQRLHLLAERSLISIDREYIEMHTLLAQLGKEIVRKQSVREPGHRQFLVDKKDICEVLTDYKAMTRSVIGLDHKEELKITANAFEGMSNLQFLRVRPKLIGHPTTISSPGHLNIISPKLRYLNWSSFPMTCLPFITNLEFLVELNMYDSKLEKLWDGVKLLQNLKWMNLASSINLKQLPNLSTATSLKVLDLKECTSLVEIPSSIGNATSLQNLILSGCSSLVELPSSIGNSTNLQNLDLSECSSLVELPFSIGNVTNLQNLYLSDCSSLVELPFSIGNLHKLENLFLEGCSKLKTLPININMESLDFLDLFGCSSLKSFPEISTNIRYLNLIGTSIKEVPLSIRSWSRLDDLHMNTISSSGHLNIISPKLRYLNWPSFPMTCLPFITNLEFLVELSMHDSKLEKLWDGVKLLQNLKWMNLASSTNLKQLPNLSKATSLKDLDLNRCTSLVEIPSSIGNATNLQNLHLRYCASLVELPSSIGNSTNLQNLDLSYCSSLVELPFSIGNLHKLENLYLRGCSKLKTLPININMESLDFLDLFGCSLLKSFPEISTNIRELNLIGTSIKEVPLSIRSWSRLDDLRMSYSENLKEFPYIHNCITELHLMDTKIQELGPWVKGLSRLRELVIKGMKNLVSLPQLPDSLWFVDAENCESLERLDCSFCNPHICLSFVNCFKLNQEARDLIIQTSTRKLTVLPGGEVPACFTYRASGSSVTVKLNQKPLRTSTKFKACILVVNNDGNEAGGWDQVNVSYKITSKENALTARRSFERLLGPILTEHLYIFDFEIEEVTSTKLVFKFLHSLKTASDYSTSWSIKECGILHLLEHYIDSHEEICERSSKRPRI